MALLEIKNLVKNYGDVEALKGINLSIEKGEVVVILGPSGCGKSTFLRCLNGLEEIKSGQILLQNAGELGKDIPWVKARQRIGMVFQSYELFAHLSVIDKNKPMSYLNVYVYMTEKMPIHVNYPVDKNSELLLFVHFV